MQCRKFEGNLAEASAEGANRSCGGGRGVFFLFFFFFGNLAEAAASAASMQFTAPKWFQGQAVLWDFVRFWLCGIMFCGIFFRGARAKVHLACKAKQRTQTFPNWSRHFKFGRSNPNGDRAIQQSQLNERSRQVKNKTYPLLWGDVIVYTEDDTSWLSQARGNWKRHCSLCWGLWYIIGASSVVWCAEGPGGGGATKGLLSLSSNQMTNGIPWQTASLMLTSGQGNRNAEGHKRLTYPLYKSKTAQVLLITMQ